MRQFLVLQVAGAATTNYMAQTLTSNLWCAAFCLVRLRGI
jgi:hypothetical protein